MTNITVNTLVNTLAKVCAQENQYLAISASKAGYTIVDAEAKVIIAVCASIADLYDKLEARFYSNMYKHFVI